MASELIEKTPTSDYTLADKGYEGEYIRWVIESQGPTSVISRKENSRVDNDGLDKFASKHWHLVENAFARLKHFI